MKTRTPHAKNIRDLERMYRRLGLMVRELSTVGLTNPDDPPAVQLEQLNDLMSRLDKVDRIEAAIEGLVGSHAITLKQALMKAGANPFSNIIDHLTSTDCSNPDCPVHGEDVRRRMPKN